MRGWDPGSRGLASKIKIRQISFGYFCYPCFFGDVIVINVRIFTSNANLRGEISRLV